MGVIGVEESCFGSSSEKGSTAATEEIKTGGQQQLVMQKNP